jgi:hypothetical protein
MVVMVVLEGLFVVGGKVVGLLQTGSVQGPFPVVVVLHNE